jgi:hypothetical protein
MDIANVTPSISLRVVNCLKLGMLEQIICKFQRAGILIILVRFLVSNLIGAALNHHVGCSNNLKLAEVLVQKTAGAAGM